MKSATIPPLRVTPDLRNAVEDVLREGETLSGFVEESLRAQVERRQLQQEFLARGLAAREEARASGKYHSGSEVMASLRGILQQAEKKAKRRK